ncbi:MAG: hypothetical protein KME04_05620 [Pleurocapsa minor GSE-CHR-MK-17-07R]|jgi:hypothetical protein|nr:hypothetical protein [Pleurocapsa minor GSE-CHR-MK 17-07R]
MRWFKALLAVSMLSLATTAALAAQDTTELENDILSPIFLESGVPFEYTFEDSNAVIFGFTGLAGDVIDLTMTQAEDSSLDPLVVVLGPRGEVIASDDDSGEQPLASALTGIELPFDGAYLILATSFGGLTRPVDTEVEFVPETFEITLTGNTPDTESETFELFSGAIAVGESAAGASIPAEPVYYWFLYLYEGEVVDVTLTESDYDALLMLFDTNGVRVGVNDDSPDMDTDSAILGYEVPASGMYLVFATGYGFQNGAMLDMYEGGNFVLNVTAAE